MGTVIFGGRPYVQVLSTPLNTHEEVDHGPVCRVLGTYLNPFKLVYLRLPKFTIYRTAMHNINTCLNMDFTDIFSVTDLHQDFSFISKQICRYYMLYTKK